MNKLNYQINNKVYEFSIEGSPDFHSGPDLTYSTEDTDLTYNLDWYKKGYNAEEIFTDEEFFNLKLGLTESIKKIISEELNVGLDDFKLENYHHFVKTTEDHFKIVRRTRDLFPDEFNFNVYEVIPKLEKYLNFTLTDIDPRDNSRMHIIVRINRPKSSDFNPPHKDIYEGIDDKRGIPRIINIWIPICGVTPNSSLPVVESSHTLNEQKISRTFEGGMVNGNKYRVRMIKDWDGSIQLSRAEVKDKEVLFFSPHLIHGLAVNEEEDTTRIALEFRLFQKSE